MSFVVSPSFTFRTEVQRVQMPAKKANGRVSSKANQTVGREPSGSTSFSEKLAHGTMQRFSIPSQRRQCGDFVARQSGWKRVLPQGEMFPNACLLPHHKCSRPTRVQP